MLGLMSSALKSSTMLPSALRCKAVLRSAPRLPLRAFHVTAAQAAEDVPVVSQGAFIKKLASEIKASHSWRAVGKLHAGRDAVLCHV